MIRILGQRSRGCGCSLAMRRFSKVIEDLELRDISSEGGLLEPLTKEGEWRSNIGGLTFERLGGYEAAKVGNSCSRKKGGFRCSLGPRQGESARLKGSECSVLCKPYIKKRAESGGYLFGVAIFGLRVKLDKSELIPMGRVDDTEDLALELGCKVPPLTLGLLLGPF
ncbi:hypothetical protein CK203_076171 [Vitis vinifera]|uniref:Uncharacterized protein n=1 Tax=Vitis vinifera TaxID=29760 RepID=A0A438EEP4_VITVI|nr:hypothetical protein CK203_076171 [Vitis vinifera]